MPIDLEEYSCSGLTVIKLVQGPLLTNSYIVGCEKSKDAFLIDPVGSAKNIKEAISSKGFAPKFIVLTHGHIDHIEGIADFDLSVLIHKDDFEYLKDADLNLASFAGIAFKLPGLSIRCLQDDDFFKIGDTSLKVIHTPGHTPGSVCLLAQNVLFSGDTLFFDGIGRCDLPGGDYNKLLASIKEKIFVLPDDVKVFCGHGPPTSIGRERKHNAFL